MSDNPEFRVFTGGRPPTTNRLLRMHWSTKERALDDWRQATWAAITEGGWQRTRFERARIGYWPVYPKKPLPDGDGLSLLFKLIADVVVEVGIIPEDNPEHCVHDPHNARLNGEAPWPLVVVEIHGLVAVEGHGGGCGCRAAWEARQSPVWATAANKRR